MDLIRFDKFGGQSKYKVGMDGTQDGTPFDKHFNIYAILSVISNSNTTGLKQNPDY